MSFFYRGPVPDRAGRGSNGRACAGARDTRGAQGARPGGGEAGARELSWCVCVCVVRG